MAYPDFSLSGLTKQFDLAIDEDRDLFADVPVVTLRPEFRAHLEQTVPLALRVSTEKARSEFIIAPILAELWLHLGRTIGLFSGVEFSVEPSTGLSGICDYIITRSAELLFVKAPIIMLVKAKNEDMKRGYAQCIAEMVAAQLFNSRETADSGPVYGAVTIGELWKFLVLSGNRVSIDSRSYHIEHIAKIMGILSRLATGPIQATEQRVGIPS